MDFNPKLNLEIQGETFSYRLFEALKEISETWSQREAAKRLRISHAVLNRRIRNAENKLGYQLVKTAGAGSELTKKGIKLLEKYQKYHNRLQDMESTVICGGHISTGLIDVLSNHYGIETAIYSTDDVNAIEMAKMDLVDVLVLDDPVHAFMHDFDFIPIARDHMVLVSGKEEYIRNIDELNGKKFVEIPYSAQRLAWNTLDHLRIDYEIVELCISPQNALKIVKNSDDLHTFLNNSFMSGYNHESRGSDIVREDTEHIISMVIWEKNKDIEGFKDFILGHGQEIVGKWGFRRI